MSTDKQNEQVEALAVVLLKRLMLGARFNPGLEMQLAEDAIAYLGAQPGPVDRDGLAKALRPLVEDAKRSPEAAHTVTFQRHADAVADAAISYIGARPADGKLEDEVDRLKVGT
jgi:hypothetical protein